MGYAVTSFIVVYSLWQLIVIFQRMYSIIELASMKKTEEEKLLKGQLVPSHVEYLSKDEFLEWCRIFLIKTGYEHVDIIGEKESSVDIVCSMNTRKTYVICTNKGFGTQEYIILNKLVGAMASGNIAQGIIVTTGLLQSTTLEYIQALSPEYNIKVIDKKVLEYECSSLCKSGILLYSE